MTTETDDDVTVSPPAPSVGWEPAGPARALQLVLLAVIGALLLTTAGIVGHAAAGPQPPGDDSVEAGFARDMQVHHAQAVTMSMIVRDDTTDAQTRTLAYDVALTQQNQIGQMQAWLNS